MTNPGSWMLFPAALRFACQIFFMARPPSWMASEEPVVAVPIACFDDGACHTSARMEMPWHTKLVYLALGRIETYNACGWSLMRSSERVIQTYYWELTRSGVFIRIFRRELNVFIPFYQRAGRTNQIFRDIFVNKLDSLRRHPGVDEGC